MLRRRRGWAIETAVLHRARALGAHLVRIEDEETGATWETNIETFERCGYSFDHGWGNQTALDLHHWQRQSPAAMNLQPALFA
jgi:predicted SpoU family rRNA methylase